MSSSSSICSSFEDIDPAPLVFLAENETEIDMNLESLTLKIQQLETKYLLLNAENEFRKGSEMIDEEKLKSELSGGWKLDQKCLFELLNNRESLTSEQLTKELSDQHITFDNDQVIIFSKLGDSLFDMETRTFSKPSGEEDSTVFLAKDGMVRLFKNGKQETWKIDSLGGRNKKLIKKIIFNNGDQTEKVYQKVEEHYKLQKESVIELLDKPTKPLTSKIIKDFTGLWRSNEDLEYSIKFSLSENLFQCNFPTSSIYTSYVLGEITTDCGACYISKIDENNKICTIHRLNESETQRWERSIQDGKLIVEQFWNGALRRRLECERVGEPFDHRA